MTTIDPGNRVLARVVRIDALEPIDGADKIQLATVLGFQCVVSMDWKVGDLALYFGLGSVLEENEDTAFLKGKRIGIRKIRGAVSEGLVAALDWVKHYGLDTAGLVEGQDLTQVMRVRKHTPGRAGVSLRRRVRTGPAGHRVSQDGRAAPSGEGQRALPSGGWRTGLWWSH
jgi:hypothetical protein